MAGSNVNSEPAGLGCRPARPSCWRWRGCGCDPDLVVLDEATARVDPETERRLEAAVHELMRGRTTLVIAHRLSTLREVDEIVMFEQGRVVEHGDRATLAETDGSRFRALLELGLEADIEGAASELDASTVSETGVSS